MEHDWRGLRKRFPFALATRIEFGEGAATSVGAEAASLGRRAFVVSDPGVEAAGLVDPVLRSLRQSGLEAKLFAEVETNPRAATIDRGAALARDLKADVIVAVGGGSPIDSAKAISAVLTHGGVAFDYEYVTEDPVPGPCAPVIAIPTTSGTGSEVTSWAIVTDSSRNYKMPIGSIHLAPRVAIMDPLLTLTLPPAATATTGVDALVHAIESFTARCANPISDGLSLYAIELIGTYLEMAVADGSNLEARAAMMLASLTAGIAFGNADTAAVHSMGEALGGLFDLGHGLTMAICLPHVLRLNAPAVPMKVARIGQALGLPVDELRPDVAAEATVGLITDLMRRLGTPSLADVGVTASDVPQLVGIAMLNTGNPDNPVEVNEQVLTRLYLEALSS
jgi:alcohol dehydrogenase